MSIPQAYIAKIKVRLLNSPIIEVCTVVDQHFSSDRGYFRVRFSLKNGDFLEASEYFYIQDEQIIQARYRYQWMDSSQKILRRRWDNAPHFQEITTFPHHVHVDRENNVMPSHSFGILELLDTLEALWSMGEP